VLKHARRATIALTTSALLITGLGATPAAQAAGDVNPKAAKAADWLKTQLEDGLVTSEYQDLETGEWFSYTDYGLSLDFFYAFEGLGVKRAVRRDILEAIEADVDAYVRPFGTTYAGAVGKLLAAVQEQGINPARYADGDLLTVLEGMVHTADDSELGRAEDSPSDDKTDSSNTLGQSFVARALAAADSELADETVEFLLKQQCSNGYFRVYMESADHTCDSGKATDRSAPSVDATAAAVLALVEVRRDKVQGVDRVALGESLTAAKRWLLRKQAKNGSFADGGVANSNSTGLAAQALDELGKDRRAAKAASWLSSLRVTAKLARNTAYKRRDVGAVAFSKAALREGKQDGISRDVVYQWRRSTAQAAVGLDASS
jgi:hypothetical protein